MSETACDPNRSEQEFFESFSDKELSLEEVMMMEEPTQLSVQDTEKEQAAAAAAAPHVPIPVARNLVSGRYRNTGPLWHLELRVDVDGRRPLRKISGDFYRLSGTTVTYFGSFIVETVTLSVTPSIVTIEGVGRYTYSTSYPKIRVTIPRTYIFQPRAAASIQFFTPANLPGAKYVCAFSSIYFRTVQFEQDWEKDVVAFGSYNTGSLPSGGPARTLSVASAYGETLIEFRTSIASDQVDTSEAGTNLIWSNSELHASMLKHFSLWRDEPQWKVWLLAAYKHDLGPGLYGIMFDQLGKQRQGCATFHHGIGGSTSEKLRLQLYTYVHELGHCFNLLHSWQKSFAVPPAPNRPDALSWMNYPWGYPAGPDAFWAAFPFQFDTLELAHLRHAFRDNIIIGGNNFTIGSALTSIEDPEIARPLLQDHSGLELRLKVEYPVGEQSLIENEPVVIEEKLTATDTNGVYVDRYLHPNFGRVIVSIKRPSGIIQEYKPAIQHCMIPNIARLTPEEPMYESSYIGYGKEGRYFTETGEYKIRATYISLSGEPIVSNILKLKIRPARNGDEENLSNILSDEDAGMLLYLMGSDAEELKGANEKLAKALTEYPDHRLTNYIRFIDGINQGRNFKTVMPDKKVQMRKAKPDESIKSLRPVMAASEKGKGLDNITLNWIMRYVASQYMAKNDPKSAKSTLNNMVEVFNKKKLNKAVLKQIQTQVDELIKSLQK